MFIGREFESSNAFIAYPFDEASHRNLNFDARTPDYAEDARLPADAFLDIVFIADPDYCNPLYMQSLSYDEINRRVYMTVGCTPHLLAEFENCLQEPGLNDGFGDDPTTPVTSLIAKATPGGEMAAPFGNYLDPPHSGVYNMPPYGLVRGVITLSDGGHLLHGSFGVPDFGTPAEGLVKLTPSDELDTGFRARLAESGAPSVFTYILARAASVVEAYGCILVADRSLYALDLATGRNINTRDGFEELPAPTPGWAGVKVLSLTTVNGTVYADVVKQTYDSAGLLLYETRYPCARVPADLSAPTLAGLDTLDGPVPYTSESTTCGGDVLLRDTGVGDTWSKVQLSTAPVRRYVAGEYNADQLQPAAGWSWPSGLAYHGVAALADGSVMVYGTSDTVATGTGGEYEYEYEYADYTRSKLIKLTSAGFVDLSFTLDPRVDNYRIGSTEQPGTLDTVTAVAEQPDGKLLVAITGFAGGCSHSVVFRLLSTGVLDETFKPFAPTPIYGDTPGGGVGSINQSVLSIAARSDGSLLFGGAFHPQGAPIPLGDGARLSFRLSDSGAEMYTEPGSDISARAVVTPALTNYLTARGGSSAFGETASLRFDTTAVDRRPARVDSVAVGAAIGDVLVRMSNSVSLRAGFNIALRRVADGVQIDAVPGAGAGKAPCGNTAAGPTGLAAKLGEGAHDLQLVGDSCYEIAPTDTGTLVISGGCDACCDCEDYLAILGLIASTRKTNADIARRINAAVDAYHRILSQAECSDVRVVPRSTGLKFVEASVE